MQMSRYIRCLFAALCLAGAVAISVVSSPLVSDMDACHDDSTESVNAWVWDGMPPPAYAVNMPQIVALTFDDGPHWLYTAQILDYLKQENVKATFFVLGAKAKYNQSLIRRMSDEGHQIGNHGYNHRSFIRLSNKSLKWQLAKTEEIIETITGKSPTMTRPPYGEYSNRVKDVVTTPLILWSVDPRDWATRNAEKISAYVIKKVKAGDIILLHDIRWSTVKAVKEIVPALKAKGYTFVTVEDLLTSVYGGLNQQL